jgi:hypothetical protein
MTARQRPVPGQPAMITAGSQATDTTGAQLPCLTA